MILTINPPPNDKKCECCGVHIKDLSIFGKEGDPLVGNFEGAKLVKIFRPMLYRHKKEIYNTKRMWIKPNTKNNKEDFPILDEKKFMKKYGKKKLEEYWLYEQLCDTIEASWECRNCIILSNKEYFNRKRKQNVEMQTL